MKNFKGGIAKGAVAAGAGALVSLVGPLLLPFITVVEDEVSLTSLDVSTGVASAVLALLTIGLAYNVYKKRVQLQGMYLMMLGTLQLALMGLTYHFVWDLTPCDTLGLSVCSSDGTLIKDTLVTLDVGLVSVVLGSIFTVMSSTLVVLAHPEFKKASKFLRVGLMWQDEIVSTKVFHEKQLVTVGEGSDVTFSVPMSGVESHALFEPHKDETYFLEVPSALELDKSSTTGTGLVRKGDHGILNVDEDTKLFFNFTGAETKVLPLSADANRTPFALSLAATIFLTMAIVLPSILTANIKNRKDFVESLENKQSELIEITLEELEEMTEEEEELEGVDHDTTAKKADNEEGKFGDADTDPNKESKVPRMDADLVDKIDVKNLGIAKVLGGEKALTGALGTIMAGDTGALNSKMAVAMSGEGGELVIGHGAGGMGFKGTGTGGGGSGGIGAIRGLGNIHTGNGVGKNANIGIGRKKRKKVAKLRVSGGRSTGGCDKGNIAKNVRRRAAALRACYEVQLLKTPSLRGKVTLQWTISTDGRVANPKVVGNSLKNNRVTDCVTRTIKRVRFKKPEAGICIIQWPFVFSPG